MPTILSLPDQHRYSADPGECVLDAALRAQVPHTHACGGHGRCSTCRVLIVEGLSACAERGPAEQRLAERLGFDTEVRLACQLQVSGDVTVRRLVLDDEDLALADLRVRDPAPGAAAAVGDEKPVAILFADIRGFTAFSGTQLPYDVIHLLNRWFHRMGRAIDAEGGEVNNQMGDGLMALFGHDDAPDAALRAVRAGLAMLDAMDAFKPYVQRVYGTPLDIGVGIHHGDVVVGGIGTGGRTWITAIGDAVNLASRIESANKTTGTRLLVSQAVRDLVGEAVRWGCSGRIALKGKGEQTLHEVRGIA